MTAIADWLQTQVPAGEFSYSSNSFTTDYPGAAAHREIASGLLATFVDQSRENLLLWFRPEVPSTVTWGGDPRKPVLAGSGPVVQALTDNRFAVTPQGLRLRSGGSRRG